MASTSTSQDGLAVLYSLYLTTSIYLPERTEVPVSGINIINNIIIICKPIFT
jgi:hypothetical protein